MPDAPADPRCPECGEPIGQTATYCMHCSADLADEQAASDADRDGAWDRVWASSAGSPAPAAADRSTSGTVGRGGAGKHRWSLDVVPTPDSDGLLAPDGIVDDTLTVLVDILGGVVVGLVSTIFLAIVTGGSWATWLGLVLWLGSTAYLVRRRTVQRAVERSGYVVAVVLLVLPAVALSPAVPVDGGLVDRAGLFVVLLVMVAVPAAVAAGIGWIAARFVPDDATANGSRH